MKMNNENGEKWNEILIMANNEIMVMKMKILIIIMNVIIIWNNNNMWKWQ